MFSSTALRCSVIFIVCLGAFCSWFVFVWVFGGLWEVFFFSFLWGVLFFVLFLIVFFVVVLVWLMFDSLFACF